MGDQPREARITLGSKSYVLETSLPAEQFDQIDAVCQNLYRRLGTRNDHEKSLVLGWMFMAYKLVQTEEKLNRLLEKYRFDANAGRGNKR